MLFSIITICKNNLTELMATHESIVNQDFHEYEWIVVDGLSRDGTKQWLQKNNEITRWVSEADDGIYHAMNKGLALSTGQYVIFMNSGDMFENGQVLSKVKKSLAEGGNLPVLIYGDSVDLDEDNNKHYRRAKNPEFIKYGMITQHQAMFFNRHKISRLSFLEKFKLSADYAMISEVIASHKETDLLRLEFPICTFRMGGVNESKRFLALREDYNIRKEILRLSWLESSILYSLHYAHALLKQSFKKTRFMRHKRIPA